MISILTLITLFLLLLILIQLYNNVNIIKELINIPIYYIKLFLLEIYNGIKKIIFYIGKLISNNFKFIITLILGFFALYLYFPSFKSNTDKIIDSTGNTITSLLKWCKWLAITIIGKSIIGIKNIDRTIMGIKDKLLNVNKLAEKNTIISNQSQIISNQSKDLKEVNNRIKEQNIELTEKRLDSYKKILNEEVEYMIYKYYDIEKIIRKSFEYNIYNKKDFPVYYLDNKNIKIDIITGIEDEIKRLENIRSEIRKIKDQDKLLEYESMVINKQSNYNETLNRLKNPIKVIDESLKRIANNPTFENRNFIGGNNIGNISTLIKEIIADISNPKNFVRFITEGFKSNSITIR